MTRAASIATLALAALLSGCFSKAITLGATDMGEGAPRLAYDVEIPMWDHYCVGIEGGTVSGRREKITRALRQASARGWELVAVSDGVFCFKRPRPSEAPAPGAEP